MRSCEDSGSDSTARMAVRRSYLTADRMAFTHPMGLTDPVLLLVVPVPLDTLVTLTPWGQRAG